MAKRILKIIITFFILSLITVTTIFVFLFREDIHILIYNIKNDILDITGIEKNVNNTIIKYNGATVDEAVKSNELIDNKAVDITKDYSSDSEKARQIYLWIGSNIEYDNSKADDVMSQNKEINNTGAVYAYRDRSGVCFDYACLYVAMAKSADLKVRLLTGKAYDGEEYVSHAWNQVYCKDEERWINVDSTFFVGGNYFDSENFKNYKEAEVIGEW